MSQSFVGEIRSFGFNFAPYGWQQCDGSLLAISQNATLFNLIGTTYGGDGQSTFALPDLRGRQVVHTGGTNNYVQGQSGGAETVTIIGPQVGSHTHAINALNGSGSTTSPVNGFLAGNGTLNQYGSPASGVTAAMLGPNTGGGQPHSNLMPYLCINYCISLYGVYPSQN